MRLIARVAPMALTLTVAGAGVMHAQGTAKIAYVNTAALLENAPGRAAAQQTLQRESEGFRAQSQKMSDSLDKVIADYQKAEPTLSASAKETRTKQIQELQTEFQAKQLQLQQQFAQRQNELMAPIREQVMKVLDDIRGEDGYSMILANDPDASLILSADKNLDITDRVVARLRTLSARTSPAQGAPVSNPSGVTRPKPPTQ
jgi:outer membrane protein